MEVIGVSSVSRAVLQTVIYFKFNEFSFPIFAPRRLDISTVPTIAVEKFCLGEFTKRNFFVFEPYSKTQKPNYIISGDLDYAYPSLVPLDSETHGGEDVAVFAVGPWQHLFTASYEQNLVPHLMAYAMCISEDKHENCGRTTSAGTKHQSSTTVLLSVSVILGLRFFLQVIYLILLIYF